MLSGESDCPEGVTTCQNGRDYMTERPTYVVGHYMGDPRAPEYKNGLIVSRATYQEGGIYLIFKVVGSHVPDSQVVRWHMEAPANTRKILGKRWKDRAEIFENVIQYMSDVPLPDSWFTKSGSYGRLSVDESKITSWFSTKLEEFDNRLKPIQRFAPARNTLLVWVLGVGLAFLAQDSNFAWLPSISKSIALMTTGLLTTFLLLRDARNTYTIVEMTWRLNAFTAKRPIDPRREAIKSLIGMYRLRYSITATGAILFVYLGLQ